MSAEKMQNRRSALTSVALADVLRDNGETELLDEIMEIARHAGERPPLILHWKRAQEFVAVIHDLANPAQSEGIRENEAPKPPFRMPEPLTTLAFKKALLEYARTGQAEPLGTTCLPCNTTEVCRSEAKLADLRDNEWVQYIARRGGADQVLPLANLYTIMADAEGELEAAIYARPQRDLWNE